MPVVLDNIKLEFLLQLKYEVNRDALLILWVQTVLNYLSLAQSLVLLRVSLSIKLKLTHVAPSVVVIAQLVLVGWQVLNLNVKIDFDGLHFVIIMFLII